MAIRMKWSLRARLTAAATLVIMLLLSVAAVLLVWRVHAALLATTDASVRREASDIAATARDATVPRIPSSTGTALIQVTDANGAVVASSPSIDGEPLAFPVEAPQTRPALEPRTVAVRALDGAPFRVVVATSPGSPAYHVYVGHPLSEVDQSTAELATSLAAGVPLLVLFFAGLTWVFAGRALKPVENLRRQAAEISVSDLHRRLDVPGTGDELQRLGVTLNDLLDRLDRSLDRQRQFVADAAHELRSPVAAIQAQAEVADHVGGATSPSPMAMESARLAHLVDDLLALARLDAQPRHRQALLDLDEVVLREAGLVGQVAGPEIDTSGVSPVQVLGDHGHLARAVRNLMDNAGRYAASRVVVSLQAHRNEAVLVICDDGPGIPEADRERILERFTRLDDTRTRSTGGVGLGLAIVSEVVAAHGGQLAVEDGAPGARLVVRLPRA